MEIRTPTLVAQIVQDPQDVRRIQEFRTSGFCAASGSDCDADSFDARCSHIVVMRREDQGMVGCLRVQRLQNGGGLENSYSSQFYDLAQLSEYPDPLLELGRLYVSRGPSSADAIRLIWAMVAGLVDRQGAGMLIGCTSFSGTDVERHQRAFGVLGARYLGPERWLPRKRSRDTVSLCGIVQTPDPGGSEPTTIPPLLRSYLAMGGWVGDHAVVDHALSTMHVFTALEVAHMPARRAARLRQIAA